MSNSELMKTPAQEEAQKLIENVEEDNKSTNASVPAQEGTIPQSDQPVPTQRIQRKLRTRLIGDIINFDGVLYKVYKIKNGGKKIGLRRMNNEEVKVFLVKQYQMQEAAIRKAKKFEVDPRKVIDMPQTTEQETAK